MISSGLAVLRSHEPLALGRWHRVSAERLNKDGSLRVDGGRPVLRSSPGKSQGLNLHTLLYLGGVEPSVQLSPATNMSAHFRGCVGEVRNSPQRNSGSEEFQVGLPATYQSPGSTHFLLSQFLQNGDNSSHFILKTGYTVLSFKASRSYSGFHATFYVPA